MNKDLRGLCAEVGGCGRDMCIFVPSTWNIN